MTATFPSPKLLPNAPQGVLSSGNVFNDGHHDILVSGSGDCTTNTGTQGVIYEIVTNGAPIQKAVAPACASVRADPDGDGIADLVGVNQDTIFIWKGDGNGNFEGPVWEVPSPGPQNISDFVFRDMDRDGHTDIVTAGGILYGQGNFKFNLVPAPATVNQRFLVGDFDGDSVADILTSSGILFGQGNRSFTAPTGSVPPCWMAYARNPVAADLNGDGKDDVVCGTYDVPLVEIYDGAGRSGLVQDQTLMIPWASPGGIIQSISVGDFNGDGRPDIAVGTGSGPDDVVLFTANADGTYQISSYPIGVNPIDSIVGDFNGDGALDIAFLNFIYDYKPPAVEVLLHK